MKRLTLLRHAKSSWSDERLPDVERPLNARGNRDAPLMGARLKARGEFPSLILSSHAVRAKATARLVAEALGSLERIRLERTLYHADPAALLHIASGLDDGLEHVVLVAHNPGLTDFANRLLPDLGLANLPTAGIVAVDLATAHWAEVGSCPATLVYVDAPKHRG